MNSSLPRRKRGSVKLSGARWVAYATASGATAIAGVNSAEATIHYSGVINEVFNAMPGGRISHLHTLGSAFSLIAHQRSFNGQYGRAFLQLGAASTAGFNGFVVNHHPYISKLASGINPAAQPFPVGYDGYSVAFASGNGFPNSQWLSPGTGFIGLRFNNLRGTQYGWIRLTMDGSPGNSFTLVDFAWGDVGDTVLTGQIPGPGSLGLLAIGSVGLLAWRKQRAKKPEGVMIEQDLPH